MQPCLRQSTFLASGESVLTLLRDQLPLRSLPLSPLSSPSLGQIPRSFNARERERERERESFINIFNTAAAAAAIKWFLRQLLGWCRLVEAVVQMKVRGHSLLFSVSSIINFARRGRELGSKLNLLMGSRQLARVCRHVASFLHNHLHRAGRERRPAAERQQVMMRDEGSCTHSCLQLFCVTVERVFPQTGYFLKSEQGVEKRPNHAKMPQIRCTTRQSVVSVCVCSMAVMASRVILIIESARLPRSRSV